MAHVARVRWGWWRPARPKVASRHPRDGGSAASHLGGPVLVLASSASLQSSAALATTVFAVYGALGTGALRFAIAAPVLLAVAAAAVTVLSLVLSRRLATASAGIDGMAIAVAVAACVTLPVAIEAARATGAAYEVALVAAVAVLGLCVPYTLEYVAIRMVSVRTFSVLLSLDPAIAAVAGAVWLGQRLALPEGVGRGARGGGKRRGHGHEAPRALGPSTPASRGPAARLRARRSGRAPAASAGA